MANGRLWTQAEDEAVRAGARDGRLQREVAAEINRSVGAIGLRARFLGVSYDSHEKRVQGGYRATALRDPVKHRKGMIEKRWSAAHREAQREKMRRLYQEGRNGDFGKKGVKRSEETRARIAESVRKAHADGRAFRSLAWLPAEHRRRYEYLRRHHGVTAARVMIEAEIVAAKEARKAAEQAMLAAMTPHERNLWKLKNGARLIERPVMRAANDYHLTLGGVASYGA